jgi:hypothetical protein
VPPNFLFWGFLIFTLTLLKAIVSTHDDNVNFY